MQIQVNTDNHITNSAKFSEETQAEVEKSLATFSKHITRVEVYFQDENKNKGGQDDKTCKVEVRLQNHQPLVSKHRAGTLKEALSGATTKAKRIVGDHIEKHKEHR